ncbi:MAG: CotH kinase family protein, partial [Verrucomicrobia bacterium]|nr:CotH kinase family protein [Verrucomicrobiota bacterium]
MLAPDTVIVHPVFGKWLPRFLFCTVLGFGITACGTGQSVAAQTKVQKPAAGEDLFREAYIPKLQIEIPAEGLNGLRRSPRKYVAATIREGATVYTNVAIHLKGGPGSYRALHDLPAFTLNFDRLADGQSFHGLKKIHLNNSVQDRSFVSEKISRELFEAAGVPTPRAGNALVILNERELGMYVLVEGIDKPFLRRHFKDPGGNVYDGHSQTDVNHRLPTNSGDDRQRHPGLEALARAVHEPDSSHRLAALEKTLDLDRFLSFLALEAMLWHWDGYTMNRNNFRIFHDRAANRMVFLPQG